MSLYIVREARELGAPRHLIARMLANVALDGVVGAVPFLGDAFDVMWRANRRNMALLRKPSRPRGAAMTAPLVVSIPHRLGKEEAVRRLKTGSVQARTNFSHLMSVDEEVWNGDCLTFRLRALGQSASGTIDVAEDHLRLEVPCRGCWPSCPSG